MTKVYLTHRVLSKGVEFADAEIQGDVARLAPVSGRYPARVIRGKGVKWHEARDDAERRRKEIIATRIQSLRRQIERLEKL